MEEIRPTDLDEQKKGIDMARAPRVRRPAVSGMFYAGTASELAKQIEWCYEHELGPGAMPQVNDKGPRQVVAAVIPHAGYVYSGPVAAHAYRERARDGVPDTG